MFSMRMGMGLGVGTSLAITASSAAEDAVDAWIAAMNEDSASENTTKRSDYVTLFGALMTAGVWDKLDAAWVLCTNDTTGIVEAADACLINIVDPTMVGTSVTANGSYPYLVKNSHVQGHLTNGNIGGYIKTGYSPDGTTSKCTRNNHSFGVWRIGTGNVDTSEMGAMYSSGAPVYGIVAQARGLLVAAPTTLYGHYHRSCGDYKTFRATAQDGFTGVHRRNSATTATYYINAETEDIAVSTDGDMSAREWFILARNAYGPGGAAAPDRYSDKQLAFAFAGAALTADEHTDLYAALTTFLTAMGAIS